MSKRGHFEESGILPEGYAQLEYLESTGMQYIDTGYKPNSNTRVKIKFIIKKFQTRWSDALAPFGCRTAYMNKQFIPFWPVNRANSSYWCYGNTVYSNNSRYIELNKLYELDANKNILSDKYNYTYSVEYSPFQCEVNMFIFNGNFKDMGGILTSDYELLVYDCVIYDDDFLIRNYIPALRLSDNKPGLYDLCGSICPLTSTPFYINAGSGEFLYN